MDGLTVTRLEMLQLLKEHALRANIDETAFLVVITEQGEKRNQT
jgi:hypothetical protein